jgi:hypothetical protein
MDLMMMERVGDRWEKMEGSFSTGQENQYLLLKHVVMYSYIKSMPLGTVP